MDFGKINATAATLTKNRTEDAIVPSSGLCATCIDGCIGMCEVGKSAYRGTEVIYPQPFGIITTASEKQYPVDLSHFYHTRDLLWCIRNRTRFRQGPLYKCESRAKNRARQGNKNTVTYCYSRAWLNSYSKK